jgi:hypothetical protein
MRSTASPLPLDAAEALVVVGSQAAHRADRSLGRSGIRPVQVLIDDRVEPVPALDRGELGMSSLAFRGDGTAYGSSGADLFRVDLDDGRVADLDVDGLKDVHEMTEIDGTLWLANTGCDEAVAFDLATETVVRRVALGLPPGEPVAAAPDIGDGESGTVDRFHANQIVRALDGRLYILAHHANGKQIVKLVAKRLIKMQGNGGLVDLESRAAVPLSLNGPHSVQVIAPDEQWICDSRAGVLRVYDREWREQGQIACAGWGRGVSVSEITGTMYVGISAIRKRYLHAIPSSQHSENMVQAFDTARRAVVGEARVPHVESVNNVYCVSRETAEALLKL